MLPAPFGHSERSRPTTTVVAIVVALNAVHSNQSSGNKEPNHSYSTVNITIGFLPYLMIYRVFGVLIASSVNNFFLNQSEKHYKNSVETHVI